MLANRTELLEKIRLGEDSFLELKEVKLIGGKVPDRTRNTWADELAAFANSAGGLLVLGVDDTQRDIIGVPLDRLDHVEMVVREVCEQSIRPALAPVIERMTLPDLGGVERPVLRVEVLRSIFVHQSPGGYMHRIGSSKRQIPPDHLARLFQQRSQSRLIRFDETPVLAASIDSLSEALWRRFAPEHTMDDRTTLLRKLAMAASDDAGVWHPTVAGILLASERPETYLPGAFIQAVAYRGSEIITSDELPYQLDARDITGPLDRQIFDACDFVRKNMRVAAFKRSEGGRVDMPQYSMLAVFEAITNAVAHRDYSMHGSKIRVRLFDDRLEIFSPGMLPNTMTTESLELRQAARNEVITSLLARCTTGNNEGASHRRYVMDKRGEGVPLILRDTLRLSGQRPTYQLLDDSELLLTLPAAPAVMPR